MRILLALLALLLVPVASGQPTGDGVSLAVLDSGIESAHPELSGRVTRISFVMEEQPPELPIIDDPTQTEIRRDGDGQGTAVASVAAGATLGVAPGAGIYDLQVTAGYSGALGRDAEAAAIDAMDWLLLNHGGPDLEGPRVAVLSFAAAGITQSGASTLEAQAQRLWQSGVAVIVPASNAPGVLHESPYVLTVGCIEGCPQDAREPDANRTLKPDLAAAGSDVDAADNGNGINPSGTVRVTGTPYAAANVTGIIALLWEERPDLPVAALFDILRDTALDQGDAGPDTSTGWGAVQVQKAITMAQAWEDPFLPPVPTQESPFPAVLAALAVLIVAWKRR